jgi:hypothetical protein
VIDWRSTALLACRVLGGVWFAHQLVRAATHALTGIAQCVPLKVYLLVRFASELNPARGRMSATSKTAKRRLTATPWQLLTTSGVQLILLAEPRPQSTLIRLCIPPTEGVPFVVLAGGDKPAEIKE